jgi:hypothetical protein
MRTFMLAAGGTLAGLLLFFLLLPGAPLPATTPAGNYQPPPPRLSAMQMELTGAMVGAVQGCNGDAGWIVAMRDLARAIDTRLFYTAFELGFDSGLARAKRNSAADCVAVMNARPSVESTLRGR